MVTRHSKNEAGHFVNLEVCQPTSVSDYDNSMGGVDTFDQLVETYQSQRRTCTSWKSIFVDKVDVAAVNAFRMTYSWNIAPAVPRPE